MKWVFAFATICCDLFSAKAVRHSSLRKGLAFSRCRIFVGKTFWFAYHRYFLRLNGVMARVIDCRLFCRLSSQHHDDFVVHRERSWKEGTWEQFVGRRAPPAMRFPLQAKGHWLGRVRLSRT